MKRIFTITVMAVSLMLSASIKNTTAAQPGVGVDISYQDFYDDLSPYGEWIDYPEYGYVWMPNAGADFRPYSTNGHWVWSDDYEWMWVSDYDWGWAPFHYGRWFQDASYGWMWMPGYEWAPAWVAWRDGGDYYGWAPLRPGINISIGFSMNSYNPPSDYWCFTPRRYISSRNVYNYCVPQRQNITIINNTTIINNYSRRTNNTFITGPRRGDAERYTGRISPVRFRESNTPGRSRLRNNEVSFYRPNIQRDDNRNFAPRNARSFNGNGQNNGNSSVGRNDNNNGNGRRNIDISNRRNDDNRPGNDNSVADRRRNIFNRDNNTAQTGNSDRRIRERQSSSTNERVQTPDIDRNRNRQDNDARTVRPFERRNNDVQQPDNRRTERRIIADRGNTVPQQNDSRRTERPNVFERNNTSPSQPNRREINNSNQSPQRQSFPQAGREQRQPQQQQQATRQFESRRNDNSNQQRSAERRSDGRGRRG